MPALLYLRRIMPGQGLLAAFAVACLALTAGHRAFSQTVPIAIVPVAGVQLSGALDVTDGKAIISTSGSVTAGEHAATITLPRRGNLRVCATTKVNLTADSSAAVGASGEVPGLMMAVERGALEANFATGKNSDVVLTPDFRILISGPGTAQVQVRLGPKGDTCVDNRGPNAPYVTVSSIFDGGVYRVQPDQRVMFQHGSLREVIDNEKESCGCPPEPKPSPEGNEFPVAQSEGLAPAPPPTQNAAAAGTAVAQVTDQFSYDGSKPRASKAAAEEPAPKAPPTAAPDAPKKPGFLGRVGHFFRKIFGG